ncbi:hypothetical protein SKAU_G00199010 [Synaphobranchus kaupii]|uniref:E3 ubiquitin-protein ligase MSL2 n=1 Tax=Synaphobranchus kaupii TaxID=118154 RepID=A0A9Q1FFE4_SYNKA|nr:hypothetical protein SKAU_G00199010 [Synaphobranchus kaupii]
MTNGVCRSVLQCDPRDPQSLAQLFKLLPFFKQSLSCLVCGNLLKDPIAPTNSSCQHYVCKACKGQKMNMKQSCSWCKDYEQFEENKQLSILVECYKKLFEYIAESSLARHITSSAGDCPEVLELLKEGLSLTERGPGKPCISLSMSLSRSPTPSASEADCGAQPEAFAELQEPLPEARVLPPSANRLDDCSGLAASSVPSPKSVSAPIPVHGGEGPKPQSFPDGFPDCEAAASVELCTDAVDGFGEVVKRNGGPLLLSVEEVLQSLDPIPSPEGGSETPCPFLGAPGNPNGLSQPSPVPDSRALTPRHPQPPSSKISCSAATPKTVRLNRKRSRSESDSEKIQPLPIGNIIQGPPIAAAVTPVIVKLEASIPALPAPTVTNGSMPKVSKLLVVSSKGIRKNSDHGTKKLYAKARQTVPKTKDKSIDRLPVNSLEPGNLNKVVYKKPQEKKGCKCGRATQNPSVLTCRGQRCPCYSNRKACLDCICRGCQNSYMANGEKKLEAFAVPEKALEQTRLTLGINLTSIAVRNAGPNGSVLNMSASSPVTAFLTAGSHDGNIFDENLDMRF